MTCEHHPPHFGCGYCIEKRGPIFDNEIDYRMHQLRNVHSKLCGVYEENSKKIFDVLDTVIDEIEEIIYHVREEAKIDPD